jgi:hypothetical protein
MIELSISKDQTPEISTPSIWNYIISVAVSIVLILTIPRLAFNLVPERPQFVDTEKAANETYANYFQKLDSISKKYEKEFKSLN